MGFLAATLRERAAGVGVGAGATQVVKRDRDAFDAELAACINAVLSVAGGGAVAAGAGALARAAVAIVVAGEGAMGDVLRFASLVGRCRLTLSNPC